MKFKSTLKKPKLKYRTILILIASGFSVLFIALISIQLYVSAYQYLRTEFEATEQRKLLSASQKLDDQLQKAKTLAALMSEDGTVWDIATGHGHASSSELANMQVKLTSLLHKARAAAPHVAALCVITPNGFMSSGDIAALNIDEHEFKKHFQPGDGEFHFQPGDIIYSYSNKFSSLSRRFFFCAPIQKSNVSAGVLCVVFSDEFLPKLLGDISNIAVISASGSVFYNNSRIHEAPQLREALLTSSSILSDGNPSFKGITVLYEKDTRGFDQRIISIRTFVILFCGAVILAIFFLSGKMSGFITKPINELTDEIKNFDVNRNYAVESSRVRHKGLSTRQHILYYLLLLVLSSFLLVSGVSVVIYSRIVENNVQTIINESVELSAQRGTEFFKNILSSSVSLAYDEDILASLANDRPLPKNIYKALPYTFELFKYDVDIAFYDNSGTALQSTDSSMPERYTTEFSRGENYSWSYDTRNLNSRYITLDLGINQIRTLERLGYYKCHIDELFLYNCYAGALKDAADSYVHTADDTIVSSANKNLIGSKATAKNAPGTFAITRKLGETGFYITAIYNENIISGSKTAFFENTIYLLMISILTVFTASTLLSHYFAKSFSKFVETLSAAGTGEATNMILGNEYSVIEEFGQLNTAFRRMAVRIQNLLEDSLNAAVKQHEISLGRQRAEFALLQAQINPHFLYNTFESINLIIRTGNKMQAVNMINSLSYMLRFAVKKDEVFVPLQKELEYAKTYVNIMKTRYGDSLDVKFDFENIDLSQKVLKFILQPLIENSIEHGLRPKGTIGEISIHCEETDGLLILTVRDNGVGMSPSKLSKVKNAMAKGSQRDSIGLNNIYSRIVLTYGDDYEMVIFSEENKGTSVTIPLPKGKV